MRFGLFFAGELLPELSLAAQYDALLEDLAAADAAGLDEAWLTELHYQPPTLLPAPTVVLAAAARATHRIRLGNLINVLPLHHPVRLAEEAAVLDHLSGGRLNFGLGRGARPEQFAAEGLAEAELTARTREAAALLVAAWRGEPLHFAGRFWQVHGATPFPPPLQRPHPPLCVAVRTLDTVRWAAEHGWEWALSYDALDTIQTAIATYRAVERAQGRPSAPGANLRLVRPIVIAEREAEARAAGAVAFLEFLRPFAAGAPRASGPFDPMLWRYCTARCPFIQTGTFEELCEANVLLFGTPDRVREQLRAIAATIGPLALVGRFRFGSLPLATARRSLALFAQEVLPHLR
ncbi:MAG TPA: LLM class flavin-dependent oxidoreductase [Chloroflexota bacterium]|nr:LLM class flavin-dependent oxidoreductase [Chloroflexota bacterium]